MKYTVPNFITEIANKCAKIPGVKYLLKPIFYKYKNSLKAKRNKQFHKYALSVLRDFDEAMATINVEYSLAYGSMLGAVREHGFIKHDLDMDVFVWAENYSQEIETALRERGFDLEYRFLVKDGKLGREETYIKNDVSIDIFYVYPAIEQYPYACSFFPYKDTVTLEQSMKKYGRVLAQRWDTPINKEYITVDFESLKLKIAANYEEFLVFTYGEGYMTPDPNYSSDDSSHYTNWDDEIAIALFS